MAEESGRVTSHREAIVRLRIVGGEPVDCLIDTGFTGALVLPQTLIDALSLKIIGRQMFEMVGGRRMIASIALIELEWLGANQTFRVIVTEDSFIGTEMLDGSQLIIDYVGHTVTIRRESAAAA